MDGWRDLRKGMQPLELKKGQTRGFITSGNPEKHNQKKRWESEKKEGRREIKEEP